MWSCCSDAWCPRADQHAKYGFGRLIDLARAGPVGVAKHGRPVVVVMAMGVRSVNGVGYAEARAGGKAGGKGVTMPRGGL